MGVIAPRDMESFLRSPPSSLWAVLVHGEDMGLVRETASRLVSSLGGDSKDPFGVAVLDEKMCAKDGGLLISETFALSLSGKRSVIWIREGGRAVFKQISHYVKHEKKGAFIVVEAGVLKKDSPLRVLFSNHNKLAILTLYEDDAPTLARMIRDMLGAANLSITSDGMRLLCDMLGKNRLLSRSEIEKLILYMGPGGGEIGIGDIMSVCGDVSSFLLGDLFDSVFSGEMALLEMHFHRLMEEAFPPAAMVTGGLEHISRLRFLRSEIEERSINIDTIISKARPPIFFKRRPSFKRQLTLWNNMDLEHAGTVLGHAEYETRLYHDLARAITERAFISLCRQARRNKDLSKNR